MRKFIIAATTIAALAVPAIAPALASADVQRNQTQTGTLVSTASDFHGIDSPTNVHTFTITTNPCDGTFTGSGSWSIGDLTVNETINGTINGKTVTSFDAKYDAPYAGYVWHSAGTDSWGDTFNVKNVLSLNNSSNYKNHGQYVSSQGGGDDAAHSCIGMPVNSSN